MTNPVIKIENLSKVYRLGEVGTGTLSHDLNRFWQMNILGKDDPYAKVGQVNDRTQKAQKGEHISALRDINLEVKQGEVLGIIGKNGAGKSTLLKLLSRVTSPTTGSIKVKGRLASLLEVGTGFNPEMTGRENIYMNGTIMGMRKWEIDRKLEEIVEFAGVAKYLDTPTKRYSSGMTVRLGFAIAAHLEPEILVVDEVLAVGDAEFQKKAIGKMQDVSANDGRTVLFVSHNMTAVKNLCQNGILLENGTSSFEGEINSVVDFYLNKSKDEIKSHNIWSFNNAPGNSFIKVEAAYILIKNNFIDVSSDFEICTHFWALSDMLVHINIFIYDINQVCIFSLPSKEMQTNKESKYKLSFKIPGKLMNDGVYFAHFLYVKDHHKPLYYHNNALSFEILENRKTTYYGKWIGAVRPTEIQNDFIEIKSI